MLTAFHSDIHFSSFYSSQSLVWHRTIQFIEALICLITLSGNMFKIHSSSSRGI